MKNTFNISTSSVWKQIAGKEAATYEINELAERFNLKSKHAWAIRFLATSVKYKLDNVTKRFEEYYSMQPNERKGNTLKNCMLRFGADRGLAFYESKNNKCKQTLENFVCRYGEVEGEARYNRCNELKSGKKESFILRHGEIEGIKRYNQFCERNRGNHSVARKIEKGMDVEEAISRVQATKERMRKSSSLAGCIEKHGHEEGTKLYNNRLKQLRYFSTTEGFKEKYGENYKEKLRVCKDSHSLDFYIRKYGELEGQLKYKQHCTDLSYKQSLLFFIEKYGDIQGPVEYAKRVEKFISKKSYSNVSQQLFDTIKQYASNNIYYATYNKEFLILSNNECYYFDFVDNDTKRVIEFNGDIYHANPQIYTAQDRPNPYRKDLTSADIWELDKQKNQSILQRGYELLVVWERDYRTRYNEVIKECEDFLKYGRR